METDNSSCLEDCGEVDIPKEIIRGPFKNAEQNTSLKIFIRSSSGMIGLDGGLLVTLYSLLTLKKGTKTFN